MKIRGNYIDGKWIQSPGTDFVSIDPSNNKTIWKSPPATKENVNDAIAAASKAFSKWASLDPLMKKSYIGTDGTVGFVSSWQSNIEEVGHGEQEITKIVEGERIDYELRFLKPFASTSSAYMTTEVVDENQTKVKWGFNGHMSYPSNLMLLFLDFEELIGNDFQTGLDNLKIILEK